MAQKFREKPAMVPIKVEREPVVPKRVGNKGNFIVQRRERPRNRGRTKAIRIS